MMKKLVLLAAILSLGFTSFAQLPISLGVKVGKNSSNINSENFTAPSTWTGYSKDELLDDAKNGMNFGAFARLKLKKFYLQPELYYSVKKGNTELSVPSDGDVKSAVTQKLKLKTVDIPLLVGMKVIDMKLASLRAFTGPVVSIIMDNSAISYNLKDGPEVDWDQFAPDNWKNNSWGWQLGAGIDVAMFVFDVRYEWGLTNVNSISEAKDLGKLGLENKSNMLTFSLGYKFF